MIVFALGILISTDNKKGRENFSIDNVKKKNENEDAEINEYIVLINNNGDKISIGIDKE